MELTWRDYPSTSENTDLAGAADVSSGWSRRPSLLSHLPIAARIALLIGFTLLTLSAVIGVFMTGQARNAAAGHSLVSFAHLVEASGALEQKISTLRGHMQTFIHQADPSAAEAAAVLAGTIARDLDTMAGLEGAAEATTQLAQVRAGVAAVLQQFDTVLDLSRTLGLEDTAGIRGKLRESVQAVETVLKQWPNAEQLRARMHAMRQYEKDFIISGDPGFLRFHKKAFNEFDFGLAGSNIDAETRDELGALVRVYLKDLQNFAETSTRSRNAGAQLEERLRALAPEVAGLFELARNRMRTAETDRDDIQAETERTIALLTGGLMVLFLILSLTLVRSLTQPLALIEGAMRRLASGDRALLVPGQDRRDEIGAMARAIEVFRANAEEIERLKHEEEAAERRRKEVMERLLMEVSGSLEVELQSTVDTVVDDAGGIAELALDILNAARNNGDHARTVAENTEEASASVQTVAAAAEQLAATAREINRQMLEMTEIARAAVTHSEQTRAVLNVLAGAAEEIGQATLIIQRIAKHTDLLALNATMEAARAGQVGRGFAVVAGEVKTLAAHTADATRIIHRQIQSVQEAAGQVIDGNSRYQAVIDQMNLIAGVVSVAVTQQGTAIEEISRSAVTAATGTDVVARRIATVRDATADTQAAAAALDRRAGQIAATVQTLRNRLAGILATAARFSGAG